MVDYTIYIIIALGIISLAVACFFAWRWMRKGKKQLEMPKEILEDFIEAERRYKASGGLENPHKILYELAKEKAADVRRYEHGSTNSQSTSPGQFQGRGRDAEVERDFGRVRTPTPSFQSDIVQPVDDSPVPEVSRESTEDTGRVKQAKTRTKPAWRPIE